MSAPANIYDSVRKSLFALCKQFKTDMATAYPTNPTMTIYNFDAFSEENGLPAGDLVGISNFSLDVDSELVTFNCMVGIATQDDENLFRLDGYSGLLLKRLLPNATITIYDSETNASCGQAKISNGTSISPVLKAIQRPLKMVAISAGLGLAIQP